MHPMKTGSVEASDPLYPKTLEELLALNPDQVERVGKARNIPVRSPLASRWQ